MPAVVHGRIGALVVALYGLGDHPEQVDVGRWRWSLRHEGGAIATWRHADNWNRTLYIRPVGPTQVAIRYPDGSNGPGFDDERDAIDAAIEWMENTD